MSLFRKKSEEINAFQIPKGCIVDVVLLARHRLHTYSSSSGDDWLIIDKDNNITIMSDQDFKKEYEEVFSATLESTSSTWYYTHEHQCPHIDQY